MENEASFYWWFEERLAYSKVKHSFCAWKNLDAAYRKMKAFRAELQVVEVNYKLIRDFELHLLNNGLSTNTAAEHLGRVKVIANELVRAGVIPHEKNPFLQFTIDTTRTEKKRVPMADILLLENIDLSAWPNVEEARDMYVFSFYCAGIRFGDLCRLKKVMVRDGYLCYTMHKSIKAKIVKHRRIKLQPSALRIAFTREGEFIFNTGVNWANEDRSISAKNALYNKWLKLACRYAGIIGLSYHTSRNSFSDHAKKKFIDVHTLKDLLGHSTVKTTEIYMQDFYQEETDAAFTQMFG